MKTLGLLFFLLVNACATFQPASREERFVIYNHGNFTTQEIQRIRTQLEVGTRALEKYIGPIPSHKFPVIVNLLPGRGISNVYRGPIELYFTRERRAPVIHELTHILAGYNIANGHWTQEGFASYMQDKYGEDEAFPTRKMAHGLVKVIIEEGSLLPMLEVMNDRNRQKYFGTGYLWGRWLAYTQSTSYCIYLIEKYGHEKFFNLYDKPFRRGDFIRNYDKTAEVLVDEWLDYVRKLPTDTVKAQEIFHDMKTSLGRQ